MREQLLLALGEAMNWWSANNDWENNGLVGLLEAKVKDYANHKLISIHRLIHQEDLCAKVINIAHVMPLVVKSVNFIRSHGLNYWEFQSFLESIDEAYRYILYYTELRW